MHESELPRVVAWTTDMHLGRLPVEAGVLDNGVRLISRASVVRLLVLPDREEHDALVDLVDRLRTFVLRRVGTDAGLALRFSREADGGVPGDGCEARSFLGLCRAVQDANDAGALPADLQSTVARAERVLSEVSRVGAEGRGR